MSANSSKRPKVYRTLRRVGALFVLPAWTYLALFWLGSGLAGLVYQAVQLQLGFDPSTVPKSLLLFALGAAVYSIGLALLLAEPYAVRGMGRRELATLLGVARRPYWRDMQWAVLGWGGYMLIANMVSLLLLWFVPIFNGEQAQHIGFSTAGSELDKIFAFLTIVLAAPVVEELVFRGYLQGSLRSFMPWWFAAVFTSLLFGAVHGQWNVGVDTFILSFVACYARERTGAVWAGVGIHMLKNLVAYYLLFLAPPWLLKIIGG